MSLDFFHQIFMSKAREIIQNILKIDKVLSREMSSYPKLCNISLSYLVLFQVLSRVKRIV